MAKYDKCYPAKPGHKPPHECFKGKAKDLFLLPDSGNAKAAWEGVGDVMLTIAEDRAGYPDGKEEPASVLEAKLAAHLSGGKLPKWIKKIRYVRNDHDKGVFVIRLPDADLIGDSIAFSKDANVGKHQNYTRPECVTGFVAGASNAAVLKQIFAYYCISHCA